MKKTIYRKTIYRNSLQGYGCFKEEIEVVPENLVREDNISITIMGREEGLYGEKREERYITDLDAFIKEENEWFKNHIEEITERHNHTLKMATDLKNG
jgi:hypothetical protein